MRTLYSNENIRIGVVKSLRSLSYDILTSREADKANKGIPDELVLEYAIELHRTVLTYNRKDYIRLHQLYPHHFGIIACKEDHDDDALANRIHAAISAESDDLQGKLLRINRPNP